MDTTIKLKSCFKRRKLKGAVLFTVVSVLAIIMVFLMATLTVVAAVQRRTHSDYAQSQSYYTARSAVDSVMEALNDTNATNQALSAKVDALTTSSGVQTLTLSGVPASMGTITSCTMEAVSSDLIRVTATARVADDESTVSVYMTCNATVTPPAKTGASGAMTSTGSATLDNAGNVFGSATLALNEPQLNKLVNGGTLVGKKAFYGDIDFTTTTNLLFNCGEGVSTYAGGTYTGKITETNGITKYYSSYNLTDAATCGLTSYTIGGTTVQLVHATASEINSINACKTGAAGADITAMQLVPYIYCDGNFTSSQSTYIGYVDAPNNVYCPVNLYCGSFSATNNGNALNLVGDVFCYDATATSTINQGAHARTLYGWVNNVITSDPANKAIIGGSFYTKGNLSLPDSQLTITGDLIVEGNLTIGASSQLTVYGDVIVGGAFSGMLMNGKAVQLRSGAFPALFEKDSIIGDLDNLDADGDDDTTEVINGIFASRESLLAQKFLTKTNGTDYDDIVNMKTVFAGLFATGQPFLTNTGFTQKGLADPFVYPASPVTYTQNVQLSGEYYGADILIDLAAASGDVYVYIPAAGISFQNAGHIIVKDTDASGNKVMNNNADGTTSPRRCIIYTEGDIKFNSGNGGIHTAYYHDTMPSTLKEAPTTLNDIPSIYIYFATGTTLSTANESLITAYATGPSASFINSSQGDPARTFDTYLDCNGNTIATDGSSKKVTWIGSFLFGKITSSNKGSLVYVDDAAGNSGSPVVPPAGVYSWNAVYYDGV